MRSNKISPSFPEAKKSLGQNFLIDKNIARKIVEAVPARAGEPVLEIGPGRGALTELFLEKGVALTVVELDDFYADFLTKRFGSFENFSLIRGDFLRQSLADVLPGAAHVVGNLPYSITSPVLFKLIEERQWVQSATLMMQLEVAQRLIAAPRTKSYGILSVWAQTFAEPRLLFRVPPSVFRPRPRVDSAVIQIFWKQRELNLKSDVYFLHLIKTAFQQRRKVMRNALRPLVPLEKQKEIDFDFNRRAEEVTIEEWVNLSNKLLSNMNRF